MFTNLYIDTTQPDQDPTLLLRDQRIYISAFVHTMIYIFIIAMIASIFSVKKIDYTKLFVFSMLIQIIGYPARAWHVNQIYEAYGEDQKSAREHIDKQYISWVFIG